MARQSGQIRRTQAGLMAALLWLVPALAGAQAFLGGEFQVNTYTNNNQQRSVLALAQSGAFVVAWDGFGSLEDDNNGSSIQARLFDFSGEPIGSEFQINTYTTGSQENPALGMAPDGRFVIAWQSGNSLDSDNDGSSIQARLFNSSGGPLGSEFQVNTYTSGNQSYPSMGMAADGSFVIAWQSPDSPGNDDAGLSIQARLYNSSGGPLGSEFQVNTYTVNDQAYSSIAVADNGDFLIAWQSLGSAGNDTSDSSIQARHFNSSGGPLGSEFQVNIHTTAYQRFPSAAVASDGGFAISWQSDTSSGNDTSGYSIQARFYQSNGNAVGNDLQVNSYTTSSQARASIGASASGGFVLTWQSNGSPGDASQDSVQAQLYDSLGNPRGTNFQVNTLTANGQRRPWVDVLPNGDFVATWMTAAASSFNFEIAAQRFDGNGDDVFGPAPGGPCTQSLALSHNVWQLFSLTCDPDDSPGLTVEEAFTGLGELDGALYNNGSNGWAILRWDRPTQAYVRLNPTDALNHTDGYWIKSLHGAGVITVDLDGASTGAGPTSLPTENGWNLFANPFEDDLDWSDADGITIDHAAHTGDDLSTAQSEGAIQATAHHWTSSGYQGHNAAGSGGPIPQGAGFWFRALEAGVTLNLPAPSRAQVPRERFPKKTDIEGWTVELVASNGLLTSPTARLGVASDSKAGGDARDLQYLAPGQSPHLTIAFAGIDGNNLLQEDFRPWQASRLGQPWTVLVEGSEAGNVHLQWTGPEEALRRSLLVDPKTGQQWRGTLQDGILLKLPASGKKQLLWKLESKSPTRQRF